MRENRLLKIICHILLPILIVTLIVSIIYITSKDSIYYNEGKYFQSEDFVRIYMNEIANYAKKLVDDNISISERIEDDSTTIYYTENSAVDVKEKYFLVIYDNKAVTNVDLTSNTSTIQEIKDYIGQDTNKKYLNVIDGQIQTNSEIIQSIGLRYYYQFEKNIYDLTTGEYITTSINDFEIYSSYVEEFDGSFDIVAIANILKQLEPYENYIYTIIPISAVFILLIILYLIIAIGHKKGVQGISLNDFDRIPLEIIFFMYMMIACLPIALLNILDFTETQINLIISVLITVYFVFYILTMITLHTMIKRIKAKMFWKTTLVGRLCIFVKQEYDRIKGNIRYSSSLKTKIFASWIVVAGIMIFLLLAFRISFLTFVLSGALFAFMVYKTLKIGKQYAEIENKLKDINNGNNQEKLNTENYIPEFRDTVNYINDVSEGIENAVQDRMKSERLKAELITNVSHDIKTPLTSIINYVDLLKKEKIENEKAKEYIEILDNKSQRLKKLTEDLIEASKVSTGNISLNLEKINIVELINQAIGEFADKFKNNNLDVIIDAKEAEINIMADSRYMYRVIENLFSNIAKYAQNNSRVYIDLKVCPQISQKEKTGLSQNFPNVIIEIKNISKDRLNISADELMQRFVRGDKSRNTEGSGLGLSIAQNLTELQNGKFNLKLDGDLFKVELIFNTV